MWINGVTMVTPMMRFYGSVSLLKVSQERGVTLYIGLYVVHHREQSVTNYLVSYQVITTLTLNTRYKHVCSLGDNQREASIPEEKGSS